MPKKLSKISPLCTAATSIPKVREIKIWRRVTLGKYKTVYEYTEALARKGWSIDPEVLKHFGNSQISPHQKTLKLVLMGPSELFPEREELERSEAGHWYKNACAAGKGRGLHLCPPEAAFALALTYKQDERLHSVTLAMETYPGYPALMVDVYSREITFGEEGTEAFVR